MRQQVLEEKFRVPGLVMLGEDQRRDGSFVRHAGREVRDPVFWEIFGSMRYAAIMVPLADRMTAAGLVPAESAMATDNYVVDALTVLLDDAGA